MSEGANAEMVREVFAAANRATENGELGDWLRFFSEEIEWEALEDAPDFGTYRGHKGIRGYIQDWFDTVDGFHNDLLDVTEVADDGVVADVRFSARIKGSENEMSLDYSQGSLIENGKVTRIKEFRKHDEAVAWVESSQES
jgi:ketosteroid isomerase-like protein